MSTVECFVTVSTIEWLLTCVSTVEWFVTVSTLDWLLTCVSTVEWFLTVSTLDRLLTCVSTVNGQVLFTVPNIRFQNFPKFFQKFQKWRRPKNSWLI